MVHVFRQFGGLLVVLLPISSMATEAGLGLIVNESVSSWGLWGWTSSGDNGGIAGYCAEITGKAITGTHVSPSVFFGDEVDLGFNLGGQDIPNPIDGQLIWAVQNSTRPQFQLFGIGSPDAGTRIPYPTVDPPRTARQVPWDNRGFTTGDFGRVARGQSFCVPDLAVIFAVGTGTCVDFGELTAVIVWTDTSSTSVDITDVQVHETAYIAIPEPPSIWVGRGLSPMTRTT